MEHLLKEIIMGRYATQINYLEDKLEKLRVKEAAEKQLSENKRLANLLHDTRCCSDHVSGGDWDYELGGWDYELGRPNPWKEYAHKKYLSKANKLLNVTSFDTIEKILEII